MQFLRILFWCLLAFVAAVFTQGNWFSVPVQLPGGLVAETNLPFLLLVTFLLGLLPTLLFQHVMRWRLRQRLAVLERQLAELRAMPVVPAARLDPGDVPAREPIVVRP